MLVSAIYQQKSIIGIHVSFLLKLPPTFHPISPSRLSYSTRFVPLRNTANSHWLSILKMVMYMFPCYSLNSSHPLLPLLCPQDCFPSTPILYQQWEKSERAWLGWQLWHVTPTSLYTDVRARQLRRLSTEKLMLLNCGVGEDLRVPWTPRRVILKGNQPWMFIGTLDCCLNWSSNTLATWCE